MMRAAQVEAEKVRFRDLMTRYYAAIKTECELVVEFVEVAV